MIELGNSLTPHDFGIGDSDLLNIDSSSGSSTDRDDHRPSTTTVVVELVDEQQRDKRTIKLTENEFEILENWQNTILNCAPIAEIDDEYLNTTPLDDTLLKSTRNIADNEVESISKKKVTFVCEKDENSECESDINIENQTNDICATIITQPNTVASNEKASNDVMPCANLNITHTILDSGSIRDSLIDDDDRVKNFVQDCSNSIQDDKDLITETSLPSSCQLLFVEKTTNNINLIDLNLKQKNFNSGENINGDKLTNPDTELPPPSPTTTTTINTNNNRNKDTSVLLSDCELLIKTSEQNFDRSSSSPLLSPASSIDIFEASNRLKRLEEHFKGGFHFTKKLLNQNSQSLSSGSSSSSGSADEDTNNNNNNRPLTLEDDEKEEKRNKDIDENLLVVKKLSAHILSCLSSSPLPPELVKQKTYDDDDDNNGNIAKNDKHSFDVRLNSLIDRFTKDTTLKLQIEEKLNNFKLLDEKTVKFSSDCDNNKSGVPFIPLNSLSQEVETTDDTKKDDNCNDDNNDSDNDNDDKHSGDINCLKSEQYSTVLAGDLYTNCEFDVKQLENYGEGFGRVYECYDELEEDSSSENDDNDDDDNTSESCDCSLETVPLYYYPKPRIIMRDTTGSTQPSTAQPSSVVVGNNTTTMVPLRGLLKKSNRPPPSKKNRVIFDETRNEFFDADYIILIREDCPYDEEDEEPCTCGEHELVRLCCEEGCQCPGYSDDCRTPQVGLSFFLSVSILHYTYIP